jgi:hypothetical protein
MRGWGNRGSLTVVTKKVASSQLEISYLCKRLHSKVINGFSTAMKCSTDQQLCETACTSLIHIACYQRVYLVHVTDLILFTEM